MFGLKNITKIYETKGNATVRALDGVNITLKDNGLVFILGKSGSGKSTLLNVMGGLDSPDTGEIIVDGVSSLNFDQADFDGYRNTYVGFVFQEFNILDEFTVGENIALALRLQNVPCSQERVNEILKLVDLEGLANRSPRTLSGGQKQRVAIARALIKDPKIIMADEPTGSLDSQTGEQVFNTLKKLSKEKLVVVVSHDRDFATTYGDRIIELADGKVISDQERVVEDGEVVFKNVNTFEDTLVISNGASLTDEDAKKIIDTIKQMGGEAVITFGEEKNQKVKKAIELKTEQVKGTFVKSKPLPELSAEKEKKEFVKSKLPLSHALKMGTSGFKRKPIRFAFTVFLSVIAFMLFGVMSTLMFYTPAYSVSRALQEKNYKNVVMSKSYDYIERSITVKTDGTAIIEGDYKESAKALFGSSEIEELNKNDLGLNFAGIYTLSNPDKDARKIPLQGVQIKSENTAYFKIREMTGFSDCGHDYLINSGAQILHGRYPNAKTAGMEYEEVAVPEYVYELYKASSDFIVDYETFINKVIIVVQTTNGVKHQLKPTGIYRISDLSKYEKVKDSSTDEYKDMLVSELSALLFELYETLEYSLDTVLFTAPDFYDTHKGEIAAQGYGDLKSLVANRISISKNMPTASGVSLSFYTESIIKYVPERFSFYNVYGESKTYAPNNSEIWLPKNIYDNYVKELGSASELENRPMYVLNKNAEIVMLNLAGYFEVSGGKGSSRFLVTDEFLYANANVEVSRQNYVISTYTPTADAKYNYVATISNNTVSEVNYILQKRGDVFMEMENTVYDKLYRGDMISSLNSLKKIFLVAGLGLGVLAALMLYNFISVSIATKRKEMGILRAVGAGRRDVFRIFFTESVVLAFICFIIASILAGIGGVILNNVLYGIFELQVVQYTIKNILLICVISFGISLAATVLPVMAEAKKSPVESIRQL